MRCSSRGGAAAAWPAVVRAGHRRDRRPGRHQGSGRCSTCSFSTRRRWASWWRPTTCAASPRTEVRVTRHGLWPEFRRPHAHRYRAASRPAHADALVRARARDGRPRAGEADRRRLARRRRRGAAAVHRRRASTTARGPSRATSGSCRAAPPTRWRPSAEGVRRRRRAARRRGAAARVCVRPPGRARRRARRRCARPSAATPSRATTRWRRRSRRLNVSVPAPGREVALRSLLPSWALAHGLRSCGSEREDKLAGARALTRRHNRSRAGRG